MYAHCRVSILSSYFLSLECVLSPKPPLGRTGLRFLSMFGWILHDMDEVLVGLDVIREGPYSDTSVMLLLTTLLCQVSSPQLTRQNAYLIGDSWST